MQTTAAKGEAAVDRMSMALGVERRLRQLEAKEGEPVDKIMPTVCCAPFKWIRQIFPKFAILP